MLLIYIVHTAILKGSSQQQFNEKFQLLEKKVNVYVVVSFVRRISELKNYPVDTGRKLNVNKTFRRRY